MVTVAVPLAIVQPGDGLCRFTVKVSASSFRRSLRIATDIVAVALPFLKLTRPEDGLKSVLEAAVPLAVA